MAISPGYKHPHEAPTGYFRVDRPEQSRVLHFEYSDIMRIPGRFLTDGDRWAIGQGLLHRIFVTGGHWHGLVTKSRAYVAMEGGTIDRLVISKHTRYVEPAGNFATLPRVRCSYHGRVDGTPVWAAVAQNCDGSELARATYTDRAGAIKLLTADQRIKAFRTKLKVI